MERYEIARFDTWGREPVIAKMKNGTIVCVSISGGPTEPHNENVVLYTKSYDDGEHWTRPEILFRHDHRGVWATEIFTEGERPFMAVHTYDGECPYKNLQTFISYTNDNGESWSEPQSFSKQVDGISIRRGIKMSNGEWLFPIYYTVVDKGFYDWHSKKMGQRGFWDGQHHISAVIVSGDEGKTYTKYGCFEGEKHVWEPNAVELEAGHILLYARDSGNRMKLGMTESFDYGRTWTQYCLSEFDNADTKVTLLRVKDKIILIHNEIASVSYQGRTHLGIRISDDFGRTWREPIPVDDAEGHYFYPHAFCDDEKEILYIAYETPGVHYLKKFTYKSLGI